MRRSEDFATAWARGVLRSEMVKQKLTYADLAELLTIVFVKDDPKNVANKIGRGTFSAAFFGQCLAVMGCKTINIDFLDRLLDQGDENDQASLGQVTVEDFRRMLDQRRQRLAKK